MILKNGLIKDITKECWITLDFLIQETWRLAKYSKFVNISKIIEYATIALILFRASPKTRDLCTCLQWKVKTLINWVILRKIQSISMLICFLSLLAYVSSLNDLFSQLTAFWMICYACPTDSAPTPPVLKLSVIRSWKYFRKRIWCRFYF